MSLNENQSNLSKQTIDHFVESKNSVNSPSIHIIDYVETHSHPCCDISSMINYSSGIMLYDDRCLIYVSNPETFENLKELKEVGESNTILEFKEKYNKLLDFARKINRQLDKGNLTEINCEKKPYEFQITRTINNLYNKHGYINPDLGFERWRFLTDFVGKTGIYSQLIGINDVEEHEFIKENLYSKTHHKTVWKIPPIIYDVITEISPKKNTFNLRLPNSTREKDISEVRFRGNEMPLMISYYTKNSQQINMFLELNKANQVLNEGNNDLMNYNL